MCLGLAGRVIGPTAEPDIAEVDVAGVVRPINVGLLDQLPAPGAWILIHSGFALEPMTEQEAQDAMAVLGGPGASELVVPPRLEVTDD